MLLQAGLTFGLIAVLTLLLAGIRSQEVIEGADQARGVTVYAMARAYHAVHCLEPPAPPMTSAQVMSDAAVTALRGRNPDPDPTDGRFTWGWESAGDLVIRSTSPAVLNSIRLAVGGTVSGAELTVSLRSNALVRVPRLRAQVLSERPLNGADRNVERLCQ